MLEYFPSLLILLIMTLKGANREFFLTLSSLRRELSPTRTLKWPRRNREQITCNKSGGYYVQHVVRLVVGRIVVVCWLLNVPATCKCISGTDLLNVPATCKCISGTDLLNVPATCKCISGTDLLNVPATYKCISETDGRKESSAIKDNRVEVAFSLA